MSRATSAGQIQKLKKGSTYAKVCIECKSISVRKVSDDKEVAALTRNGEAMACDTCRKKFTVKRVGPPGKEVSGPKVSYVDAKGRECMFIVPINE